MKLWPPPSGLHSAIAVISRRICRAGGKGEFSRKSQIMEKILKHRLGFSLTLKRQSYKREYDRKEYALVNNSTTQL